METISKLHLVFFERVICIVTEKLTSPNIIFGPYFILSFLFMSFLIAFFIIVRILLSPLS